MTKINKLMTSDLQYCTVLDNVYEAAVKMKDADVGAIPIVDEDGATLVGIVTDRDLVLRGIASKKAELSKNNRRNDRAGYQCRRRRLCGGGAPFDG